MRAELLIWADDVLIKTSKSIPLGMDKVVHAHRNLNVCYVNEVDSSKIYAVAYREGNPLEYIISELIKFIAK